MKKKIKILFTDLTYLNRNYGAQGIAFPLMKKLNEYFDAEYNFTLHSRYYKDNISFSRKNNFNIIVPPKPLIAIGRHYSLIDILYNLARLLKGKKIISKKEKELYYCFIEDFKKQDVIIDISGIEFIGNVSLKRRYLNYINIIWLQYLAQKYNKPYLKYTKSYGPFPNKDKLYKFLVRKHLNKLPFVLVRGEHNLNNVKQLNLKVPIYSFPDISISLEATSKNWAIDYMTNLGLNLSFPIIGLSPSTVITNIENKNSNSSCGTNHIKLCEKIIASFQSKNKQVLLIPHSIYDGKDVRYCDLALCKKIYNGLKNKKNVFILSDVNLTYKQVRAIIGLLNFYITARYHALSSALSMAVPAISLSWHIKYKDIMSLFLDDYLVINCRNTGIDKALSLIKKYYYNRQWFNKEKIIERKKKIIEDIDKSINMLVNEIKTRIS